MLFIFLGIFFLFLGLIITINTPWFKNKLIQKSTQILSDELNYPLTIQYAQISYFNEISLEKIQLNDTYNNSMIEIEKSTIAFDLFTLLKKEITIENVNLISPHVSLIKNPNDGLLNINEFVKAIQQRFKKENNKPPKIEFKINSIQITNGLMSFDDQRKDTIKDVFDYYHFTFQKINLYAQHFEFKNKISSFDVINLNLIEPSFNTKVHQLNATTKIGLNFIELSNLEAQIGESIIKNFIRFDFKDFTAFDDFNHLVDLKLNLDESTISSKDISIFSTTIRNTINDNWILSGIYEGKISKFKSENFEIKFGKNSIAKGTLIFDGLPDFYNTFLNIKLKNSHLSSVDITQYFPSKTAKEMLPKFGHIDANGSFTGYPLDFVAYGNFSTSLGQLTSDINLKISEGKEKAFYKGEISTPNFNLGKLTESEKYVKRIAINGKIKGTGLTLESANFHLDAKIKYIDILKYRYKKIETNAEFSKSTFNGFLAINDDNLEFSANGLIDFSKEKPIVKIRSNLEKSNLKALHLSDVESNITSNLDINIVGLELDEMTGAAKFDNLKIKYDSNYLALSTIMIYSTILNNNRTFDIKSPYFTALLKGDYKFSYLAKDLISLKNEFILNLENNTTEIENYYGSKKKNDRKYNINCYMKFLNFNPLLTLYELPIEIANNTEIFIDFKNGQNTILNLYTKTPFFKYDDYEFTDLSLEVNSSKFNYKPDILAMVLINAKNQSWSGYKTENMFIEGVWAKNRLELLAQIKQEDEENNINFKSNINFERNKTTLVFDKLQAQIYDQIWSITDSNSIIVEKKNFTFNNLIFAHENQKISLDGKISVDPNKTANLRIENFDIDLLNPLLPQPVSGTSAIELNLTDFYGKQQVTGKYFINQFTLANNELGNIDGKLKWKKLNESIELKLDLIKESKKSAQINGHIFPLRNKKQLHLNALFVPQKLKIIEPYFKSYASDFNGSFDGKIAVTGEFNYPIIDGEINLIEANVKYDYLKVRYFTTSTIKFTKDKILFPKLEISDKFGHKGVITGEISHKGFKNYHNNLLINFNNLLTLNTTSEDNTLYFGRVYATGDAKITGPISNTKLKANAKTNSNTQIFIPLNGYEGIDDKDYIQFVKFNKQNTAEDTSSNPTDFSGINMDFNFEITPDAYMEIIFDPKSGDIMRGNGEGNLNLAIDTRGEFNMYGEYKINKGTYNFTLLDIVNKEFEVTPGSTVSWNGDPYQGKLNVEAKYIQRVTLSPIVLDTTIWLQNPSFKSKKYPTYVILNLDGDLLQPEINLDISIAEEYPLDLQASVNSFENEIKNNEQELNRQVFSLIVLKQFAQLNSFNNSLGLGGSAGRSMSELISNQLSYWMSQVDDNLQIDLDLGSLNTTNNNSYQLRLSYSLLDGRLRLSNQTDYDKSSDLSSITGEWTVEYIITKDGRLRLKMYNRTSQNNFSNDIENSTQTTAGASIVYTKGFNNLKELFKKKDNKDKKK